MPKPRFAARRPRPRTPGSLRAVLRRRWRPPASIAAPFPGSGIARTGRRPRAEAKAPPENPWLSTSKRPSLDDPEPCRAEVALLGKTGAGPDRRGKVEAERLSDPTGRFAARFFGIGEIEEGSFARSSRRCGCSGALFGIRPVNGDDRGIRVRVSSARADGARMRRSRSPERAVLRARPSAWSRPSGKRASTDGRFRAEAFRRAETRARDGGRGAGPERRW